MARARLPLALLAALLVAAGCGSSGHQQATGTGGTIVLHGSFGGREGIYAVRPDGRGLSRLKLGVSNDDDVYWNPAGTTALVVVYGEGPSDHAFLLDVASGKRRPVRVPNLYGVSMPAQPWSTDGRRLLLERGDNPPSTVIYNVASRRFVAIAVPEYKSPSWSGDGRSVIFSDGHSVYAVSARGGRPKRLARFSSILPEDPQSSADGKWISFVDGSGKPGLHVARTDGTRLQTLRGEEAGTWSPSGARFAFAGFNGAGILDPATGNRSVVVDPLDTVASGPPSWSPDGKWILFERSDLAGADYGHLQLWAMRPDTSSAHPLTHAFPPDGGPAYSETWIAANLAGTPVPRPPLVAVRPDATMTTGLPVVALSANGDRAAIAEGFGYSKYYGPPGEQTSGGPLGPIVVWNTTTGAASRVAVHHCRHVPTVLLAGQLAYVCDNSAYEQETQSFRVGSATLARTTGGQGIGTFLDGSVTDGHRIVFGVVVNALPHSGQRPPLPQHRIYEATPSGRRLLRQLTGYAQLESIEGRRIAVRNGPRQNDVTVLAGHATRTFRFPHTGLVSAVLEGKKLVVLESDRLSVWDSTSGRRLASWPTEPQGDIGSSLFAGASGDLAVYITGAAIHVMRLSDGHEIVLALGPNATGPGLAAFASGGLFYAYNESYAKHPGRVGFVTTAALERAISAHGVPAS